MALCHGVDQLQAPWAQIYDGRVKRIAEYTSLRSNSEEVTQLTNPVEGLEGGGKEYTVAVQALQVHFQVPVHKEMEGGCESFFDKEQEIAADRHRQRQEGRELFCLGDSARDDCCKEENEAGNSCEQVPAQISTALEGHEEESMKQQTQSQQQAANKRPQSGNTQQPAPQGSRYPAREVPPRFMQQQPVKNKPLKGRDGEFNIWGEPGNAWDNVEDHNKDSQSDMTLETGAGMSTTPNSISGSVISSSSLCGVPGTTTSINASTGGSHHNHSNAHHGAQSSNANSFEASHCSGSSMLGGIPLNQGVPQSSSNSQSAQSPSTSEWGTSTFEPMDSSPIWSGATIDGPQGSNIPLNQKPNPIGAKSASSDLSSLQQAVTSNNPHANSVNGQSTHPDMQSGMHSTDRMERYSDNVSGTASPLFGSATHSSGGIGRNYSGCNANSSFGSGLSSGGHSSNLHQQNQHLLGNTLGDSCNSHSQNLSYGAQYSSSNMPNSQVSSNDHSSSNIQNNSSYSGWQGLSVGANGSSYKGWNIPDNGSSGRNTYVSHNSHMNSNSSDSSKSGGSSHKVDNSNMNCNTLPLNSDSSGESVYEGLIGATGGSNTPPADSMARNISNYQRDSTNSSNWGLTPPRMGLLGGGESSLNNGTSGWGGPPPAGTSTGWSSTSRQNTGPATELTGNPNQAETSTGMSPPKPHNTWAQAAGKGLNPPVQNNHTDTSDNGNNESQNEQGSHSAPSNGPTKIRGEEMTKLKIAAAYSEGWGQMGVNQDSSWDVPQSPQTSPKDTSNSVWRAPANTGTEIWENNIRHRTKTLIPSTSNNNHPWGHTPSTHIGGTWGEEEDNSNMWTGVPPNNNWNESENVRSNIWPGANHSHSHNENSNNNQSNNKNWGNQNASSWEGNGPDNGTSVWASTANSNKTPNIGTWSPVTTPKKDIQPSGWEEPSPPTSRRPLPNYDDGTALWGNPMRQGKVSHWKDMPAAKPIMSTVTQGAMPPGGMMSQGPGGGPGMAPPGPGMIRLPPVSAVNKPDVGIPVWGKPPLNRGASWSDMPPHRDSPGINSWEDSHAPPQMKNIPGTPTTPVGAFGAGWNDQTAYWGAKPKGSVPNWSDGQIDTSNWSAKQGGKPLTKDLICASKPFRLLMDMGFKKEDAENALRNSNMNLEDAIGELQSLASRENQLDLDGFGNGGRTRMRPGSMTDDACLDHPLDPGFGPGNFHGTTGFQGQQILAPAFGGVQGLKPTVKGSGINSNTTSLLTSAALSGQASSLNMGTSISTLSPALVQKILQQHQPPTFNPNMPQNAMGSQATRVSQQNFPSAAQLRHMFQQIQMAVQAGHLNPQILNHPLAPQTLQLLFQLLQQIKTLHQLQQQQQFLQSQHMGKSGGGGPGNPLQLNVQITQTKQRIVNLQNQIAAQQAMFLKQQQQQQHHNAGHPSLHTPQPSADIFKPNIDPMSGMHADFRDIALKENAGQSQSRLNQWKLPSFEKDDGPPTSNSSSGNNVVCNNGTTDFSRAPGSLSKSAGLSSHGGSNLHPLLSQGDSTWSSLPRNQNDMGGWPDSSLSVSGNNGSGNNNGSGSNSGPVPTSVPNCSMNNGSSVPVENKDSSAPQTPVTSSTAHPTYNLSDLVPEFEPGKPWKGTSQLKSVEDDPHITPGSVARSPLSVNTIKDSDLFNWTPKSSPVTASGTDSLVSSLTSLTSSTWAFTPPTSASLHNSGSATSGKSGSSKTGWGPLMSDNTTSSELWGTTISKTRGPPPGLSGQGKGINSGSWGGGGGGGGSGGGSGGGGQASRHGWNSNDNRAGLSSGWDRQTTATFLVLRNLTPQIDGSTLKTLCMQHGPLQQFHLFLNHGIALVRYQTREESAKAQSALNNCVLGNTTILADIPTEAEVQQYLQLPGGQLAAAGAMGWPTPPQAGNSVNHGYRTGNNTYHYGSSNANSSGKMDSNTWNGTSLNIPGGNHLWSFNPPPNTGTASLWASTTSIDHDQNAPAPLNSYLPGDLLNGEPM